MKQALQTSADDPQCDYMDQRVLREVIKHQFRDDVAHANMRPYLYADEWKVVSRCLRDRVDGRATAIYEICVRARNRGKRVLYA